MEIRVESAKAIAQFLRDQGYTEKGLSQLDLAELPWNSLARQSNSAWLVIGDASSLYPFSAVALKVGKTAKGHEWTRRGSDSKTA